MIRIVALCMLLAGCTGYTPHSVDFQGQPCLIPHKKYSFKLCQDLYFQIDGDVYSVPKGFVTDLASIPKFLWWYKAPNRFEHIAPAVVHDYFYRCTDGDSRKFADDVFYDMLVEQGAGKATAYKFWLAVRLFGWKHYNDKVECGKG